MSRLILAISFILLAFSAFAQDVTIPFRVEGVDCVNPIATMESNVLVITCEPLISDCIVTPLNNGNIQIEIVPPAPNNGGVSGTVDVDWRYPISRVNGDYIPIEEMDHAKIYLDDDTPVKCLPQSTTTGLG